MSALSPQSPWDQEFLAHHVSLREKISRFEKGDLCKGLKEIDNKKLTYLQIRKELRKRGFKCNFRLLTLNPSDPSLGYLKKDKSITLNSQDKDIARQEICQDQSEPECVLRIKPDGFPRNRRPMPHSTKAVLLDGTGDPGSYDNEAFKVSASGQALPKGPSSNFGLKKCPFLNNNEACSQWADKIMDEAHPLLKDLPRTP